jgi:hypothetical protein
MVFRLRLSEVGRRSLVVPAVYVLGLIAAAIAQRIVDDTATDADVTLSVTALATWVLENWVLLLGWAAFVTLFLAAIDGWRIERKTEARRTLANAYMYLVALRAEILRGPDPIRWTG